MSTPQIPNLLSRLRDGSSSSPRGGGGLRARAARNATAPGASTPDSIVQTTDDDASGSRLSAVAAAYLVDPFAALLANHVAGTAPRRQPIINRGTYVRTTAIDTLVHDFLDRWSSSNVQVVNLGAGADTRFWRLVEQCGEAFTRRCHWCELDFEPGTRRKVDAVLRQPHVKNVLERAVRQRRGQLDDGQKTPTKDDAEHDEEPLFTVSEDRASLTSSVYSLHAVDLRSLASDPPPDPHSLLPGLRADVPTLLLSECCLTYIPDDTARSILRYFTHTLLAPAAPAHIILYEPLHPDDAFGRTMTANLSQRRIALPGLAACPTLAAHADRLREVGFTACDGAEQLAWWRGRVGQAEKERLRRVEMVDEEEEWELLAGHYGFVWASRAGVA